MNPMKQAFGRALRMLAARMVVLAAMCLVDEDKDVPFLGEGWVDFSGVLELLDGGHDGLADGAGEGLLEVGGARGVDGVGEAAVEEGAVDLLVEISPVGDDDDGRVGEGLVPPVFDGGELHRETLAAPLPVPDKAAPAFGAVTCAMILFAARNCGVLGYFLDTRPSSRSKTMQLWMRSRRFFFEQVPKSRVSWEVGSLPRVRVRSSRVNGQGSFHSDQWRRGV